MSNNASTDNDRHVLLIGNIFQRNKGITAELEKQTIVENELSKVVQTPVTGICCSHSSHPKFRLSNTRTDLGGRGYIPTSPLLRTWQDGDISPLTPLTWVGEWEHIPTTTSYVSLEGWGYIPHHPRHMSITLLCLFVLLQPPFQDNFLNLFFWEACRELPSGAPHLWQSHVCNSDPRTSTSPTSKPRISAWNHRQ